MEDTEVHKVNGILTNRGRLQHSRKTSQVSFDSSIDNENNRRDLSISTDFRNRGSSFELLALKKETLFQKYTSCRWVVTFLTFMLLTMSITLKNCMSIALVCMTQNMTSLQWINQSNSSGYFKEDLSKDYVDWSNEVQGTVLTAYFYGHPVSPFIGGYLSGKFGGKRVLLILVLLLCAASMAIPVCALIDPYIVVALRVIVGITYGGIAPSVAQVNSRWAPVSERAQIVAFVNSGLNVGNILTYSISGFVCGIPIQGGWPFIFYIFGTVNLLFLIPWLACVYDHPTEHPRISLREVAYIAKNRRDSAVIKNLKWKFYLDLIPSIADDMKRMPDPPWLKILCSKAFWGLLLAHVSHSFIFTTIGTYLPIYMDSVLQYDISENGILSSLPFIGRFIGSIVSGHIADKIITKGCLSVSKVRKIFQVFGFIGSAPFILWVSFLDKSHRDLAVGLIVIYWTLQSTTNSAFRVNHLDIAPKYAGVLNGMTTTLASLAALMSPVVTNAITTTGSREEWQIVFFICVGVAVVGALTFVAIGSGEEQEWVKDENMNVVIDVDGPLSNGKESFDNLGFEGQLQLNLEPTDKQESSNHEGQNGKPVFWIGESTNQELFIEEWSKNKIQFKDKRNEALNPTEYNTVDNVESNGNPIYVTTKL